MRIDLRELVDRISGDEAQNDIRKAKQWFEEENGRVVRTRPRTREETRALVRFHTDRMPTFKPGGKTKDGHRILILPL